MLSSLLTFIQSLIITKNGKLAAAAAGYCNDRIH